MKEKFRVYFAVVGVVGAFVFITLMHFVLPESMIATVLFGKGTNPYPFTVHNLMWILFFVGFAELAFRIYVSKINKQQLHSNLLPEDEFTVLTASDLGPIYKNLNTMTNKELYLPRILLRTITQFKTSKSIEQSQSIFNASLELLSHDIDLRYNMIRYIMWLIPTLGFIGTVLGISDALHFAGSNDPKMDGFLGMVTLQLGVAFHTTLLALIMSGILVFFMHIIQGIEETLMNKSGHYCLDNLINRLYNEDK